MSRPVRKTAASESRPAAAALKGLSPGQKSQILALRGVLLAAGRKINLFSRKDPRGQLDFLLEQSLMAGRLLSPALKEASGPVLDLGSGNGLPGLACAALCPRSAFVLCERSRKKAEFLKRAIFEAKIPNAAVACQRAEDLKDSFPVLLSQAAVPLKKLPPLLDRLLTPDGAAFLWQPPGWEKSWPKTKAADKFSLKVFKKYRAGGREKILLKAQRACFADQNGLD